MPQLGAQRATPNPISRPPPAAAQNAGPVRGRTPVGIGTPQSIPTPGPTSNVGPTPSGASPTTIQQSISQQDPSTLKRGQKRERDNISDGPQANVNGQTPHPVNGGAGTPKATTIVSAKAGNAGIRPRPLKRPRLVSSHFAMLLSLLTWSSCSSQDSNGQARELPVQQPTPHA